MRGGSKKVGVSFWGEKALPVVTGEQARRKIALTFTGTTAAVSKAAAAPGPAGPTAIASDASTHCMLPYENRLRPPTAAVAAIVM